MIKNKKEVLIQDCKFPRCVTFSSKKWNGRPQMYHSNGLVTHNDILKYTEILQLKNIFRILWNYFEIS